MQKGERKISKFHKEKMKGQYRYGKMFDFIVKVTQSCVALCNPMDSTVHGILQARILEWVTIPFSRGSFQPRVPTQGPEPGLPHSR